MNKSIINYEKLHSTFAKINISTPKSFLWFHYSDFLNNSSFKALYDSYPDISFFEEHKDLMRNYNQAPHDRFYLAFEKSIFHSSDYTGSGIIRMNQLPKCWQDFIGELNDKRYNEFIKMVLNLENYTARYDWHIGIKGNAVSPHIDAKPKLASHLFYFNTSPEWNQDWGGRTLILQSKKTSVMNPSFDDFNEIISIENLDNKSLLFKNSESAWHGVEPLKCPENRFRKLFNVIFEVNNANELTLNERANMQTRMV